MREAIIERMTEIVNETMTSFQSDFFKYDKPRIESAGIIFPVIWVVGKTHTHLINVGDYHDIFFGNEYARYAYANGDDYMTFYLTSPNFAKDKVFLITEDDIQPITRENGLNAIKDYVIPTVNEWIKLNGPLPKPKMTVKLHGITFSELKGLIEECRQHNNDSLFQCLKGFKRYQQRAKNHYIDVYWNSAWHEFSFVERINGDDRLAGAIVFHGWPETGYQQNFSVQIEPCYGWSTHT
jgi:hypothetical protein